MRARVWSGRARSVLNSVAVGFVFELDDILYETWISQAERERYESWPYEDGTNLAAPGALGVVNLHAHILSTFTVFFMIVIYWNVAFRNCAPPPWRTRRHGLLLLHLSSALAPHRRALGGSRSTLPSAAHRDAKLPLRLGIEQLLPGGHIHGVPWRDVRRCDPPHELQPQAAQGPRGS